MSALQAECHRGRLSSCGRLVCGRASVCDGRMHRTSVSRFEGLNSSNSNKDQFQCPSWHAPSGIATALTHRNFSLPRL